MVVCELEKGSPLLCIRMDISGVWVRSVDSVEVPADDRALRARQAVHTTRSFEGVCQQCTCWDRRREENGPMSSRAEALGNDATGQNEPVTWYAGSLHATSSPVLREAFFCPKGEVCQLVEALKNVFFIHHCQM